MLLGRRSVTGLLFSLVSAAAKPDRMEPALRSLYEAWRKGGAAKWKEEAARLPFPVDSDNIALKLTVRSAKRTGEVRKAVTRLGGAHRAEFDELLYVSLPASALAALSENRWVAMMHLDTTVYAPSGEDSK